VIDDVYVELQKHCRWL